jgi:membrane-bound lytic murein transglycosylase MltF
MIEIRFVLGLLLLSLSVLLLFRLDEKMYADNAQPTTYTAPPIARQEFPVSARAYARSMVSIDEYVALHELIMLESSWNPDARNRKSTAYGLGQLLDQTWVDVGVEKSDDFRIQLIAAHKYVMNRYGSWQKALEFRKANGYY